MKEKIIDVPCDGTYHGIFQSPNERVVINTCHAKIIIQTKHFTSSHVSVSEGGLILGTKVTASYDCI